MCKRTFFSLCMLLIASLVEAQGILEVKDISQPNDVYASENDEAAVIIRCHESIPLTFSSSMDKTAIPFKVESLGTDSIYYIAFPTGNRYRGRVLSIYARGYSEASINLELQPKQLVSFQITDPNALVDAGCYREHRNKGVLEIKNIAVKPQFQGKSYGKAMIDFLVRMFSKNYSVLQVGTGDSPMTIPFYEKCGFARHHVVKDFFIENYDHPIIEAGVQLRDMVYLRREIGEKL